MPANPELIVKELLSRCGTTYAEEASIRLADRPGPLYQLLVLATVVSARISADIAVAAARELFAAGYRSPKAMSEAGWQDRVDALGRAHYCRYDERTATMLGDGADLLSGRWHGDLRKLRDQAGGDARAIASLLTGFPGVGPTGASIFLREVQGVGHGQDNRHSHDLAHQVRTLRGVLASRVGRPGGRVGAGRPLCRPDTK